MPSAASMPELVEHVGDLVVHRVHQRGAALEGSQPGAGQLERVRVAVDADEVGLGAPVEDGLAVPAEAEGGVDEDGAGALERRRDQRDDPVEEHRDVGGSGHGRRA